MSNQEKLQYAKSRLGLARMMGDVEEVKKWLEHVAFWETAQLRRAVGRLLRARSYKISSKNPSPSKARGTTRRR